MKGENRARPKRKEFREEDKIRVLLWSARHCCLCGRSVGPGIEIAHLDRRDDNRIENAIPLCFDCHAAIGHYNDEHPRGRRYAVTELRARREQVYEQHTRHLVSPVEYRISQQGRELPDVGFHIGNAGDTYPVRARVRLSLFQGARRLGPPSTEGHYDGRYLWNLNPRAACLGHFRLPQKIRPSASPIRARVAISVIDIYEREHGLLPVGYVLAPGAPEWYFEPADDAVRGARAATRASKGRDRDDSPRPQ
jgi:hypothetical protein